MCIFKSKYDSGRSNFDDQFYFNPRLPKVIFVTRLPKGDGYHPLIDLRYIASDFFGFETRG